MKCIATLTVKEPPKYEWKFPCFAHFKYPPYSGDIVWIYSAGESGYLTGIRVPSGELSEYWATETLVPIPRSETKNWKLVLDNAGIHLDKGETPTAAPPEDSLTDAVFPGMFWHPSTGKRTVLLEFVPEGCDIPGAALNIDGSVRTDLVARSRTDWMRTPGQITITNKPGVEYPRLYSHRCCTGFTWLRTAASVWYHVDSLARVSMDNPEACWPLPDGSSLTLTFTK